MRFYALREREPLASPKWSGGFHMDRQWKLPGVECPTCKEVWSGVGYDYPTVDLSKLPGAQDYEEARCVPWSEFVKLRKRVLPFAPPGAVVQPGTGFGALTGRSAGKFPSVVVHMPWILIMRPEVVEKLKGLTGVFPAPTRFKGRRNAGDLLELEVRPGGSIAGADTRKPCRTCGRTGFKRPPFGKLRLKKLPTVDIARSSSTLVVVSERVVERLARELEESDVVAVDVTGGRGAALRTLPGGADASP